MIRLRARERHEHDRQPAAVQYNNVSLFSTGLATTLILRRCACGDVDSVTLIGRWTLAQVRGEAETADARETETTLPVTRG